MSKRMEWLAETAAKCADSRLFGAYVRSRFFAGGFSFNTAAEACEYLWQQRANAARDDTLNDFSGAAASRNGETIALFS